MVVLDVRCERLQDISASDAVDEGCCYLGPDDEKRNQRSVDAFRDLWDSINGKRPGCAWRDTPWVWVYTFRLATTEEIPHA